MLFDNIDTECLRNISKKINQMRIKMMTESAKDNIYCIINIPLNYIRLKQPLSIFVNTCIHCRPLHN